MSYALCVRLPHGIETNVNEGLATYDQVRMREWSLGIEGGSLHAIAYICFLPSYHKGMKRTLMRTATYDQVKIRDWSLVIRGEMAIR